MKVRNVEKNQFSFSVPRIPIRYVLIFSFQYASLNSAHGYFHRTNQKCDMTTHHHRNVIVSSVEMNAIVLSVWQKLYPSQYYSFMPTKHKDEKIFAVKAKHCFISHSYCPFPIGHRAHFNDILGLLHSLQFVFHILWIDVAPLINP